VTGYSFSFKIQKPHLERSEGWGGAASGIQPMEHLKHDNKYKENHLKWTKDWLKDIVGTQSNSSGMMSRHLLATLEKTSSSSFSSSVIVKK